jgi:outer membrane lipoprotein SlyB
VSCIALGGVQPSREVRVSQSNREDAGAVADGLVGRSQGEEGGGGVGQVGKTGLEREYLGGRGAGRGWWERVGSVSDNHKKDKVYKPQNNNGACMGD